MYIWPLMQYKDNLRNHDVFFFQDSVTYVYYNNKTSVSVHCK